MQKNILLDNLLVYKLVHANHSIITNCTVGLLPNANMHGLKRVVYLFSWPLQLPVFAIIPSTTYSLQLPAVEYPRSSRVSVVEYSSTKFYTHPSPTVCTYITRSLYERIFGCDLQRLQQVRVTCFIINASLCPLC